MGRIDYKVLAIEAAKVIDSKKGEEIIVYDVRKLTSFTDYLLLSTLNAEVQMKAVSKELTREIKIKPDHIEGDTSGGWILIDYDGLVVNLFSLKSREFYGLERLWGEAKKIRYS